jgi:hypothetical protein
MLVCIGNAKKKKKRGTEQRWRQRKTYREAGNWAPLPYIWQSGSLHMFTLEGFCSAGFNLICALGILYRILKTLFIVT